MGDPDGRYSLAGNTHDLLVRFLSALPLGGAAEAGHHRRRVPLAAPPARPSRGGGARDRPGGRAAGRVGGRAARRGGRRPHGGGVCLHRLLQHRRDRRRPRPAGGGLPPARRAVRARHLPPPQRGAAVAAARPVSRTPTPSAAATSTCSWARATASCATRPTAPCGRWPPAGSPSSATWRSRRRAASPTTPGTTASPAPPTIPTSHYRAAEVFDFFAEHGLDAALLRRVSQHQVGRLRELFDALDLDPGSGQPRPARCPSSGWAAFWRCASPRAAELHAGPGRRRRRHRLPRRDPALRAGALSERSSAGGVPCGCWARSPVHRLLAAP